MASFIKYLYQILLEFFGNLWSALKSFGQYIYESYKVTKYIDIFKEYKGDFGTLEIILAIVSLVVIFAFAIGLIVLLVLAVKKLFRITKNQKNNEVLIHEIGKLNEQVIKLNKEKDRLLEIRVNQYGGQRGSFDDEDSSSDNESDLGSRFSKLIQVDQAQAHKEPYEYEQEINLEHLCDQFRNFACSRMGLYYETRIVRLFMAGLASTRLIILQGISGTGKTSFPYAWGKFLENDSLIASVQPSWRDRTELFGYFNEFTKKYNETEVLKRLYEARYDEKVHFTILDEMNIARVEYYFAEMLSILEMPSRKEWIVDLTHSGWKSDPKLVDNGSFLLPDNVWFVGTANNDDSTFAISDKVYDRAIPINIDKKGVKFDCEMQGPVHVNYKQLEELFEVAKKENVVSETVLAKIEELDNYVIEHFRLAFGNRIVKQLRDFIPVFVACGGTEVDGLDYVLCNKIFRKFEGLNLSFIRDELDGLIEFLSRLFGQENMQESKEYLTRLSKLI